jgi:hypothetical protein
MLVHDHHVRACAWQSAGSARHAALSRTLKGRSLCTALSVRIGTPRYHRVYERGEVPAVAFARPRLRVLVGLPSRGTGCAYRKRRSTDASARWRRTRASDRCIRRLQRLLRLEDEPVCCAACAEVGALSQRLHD